MVFGILGTFIDDSSTNQKNASSPERNFSSISKKRFDQILEDFNEISPGQLGDIECLGECTGVAYFHFNTVPNDLQTVIRAQAVTFSRAKLENMGTSNVTILATVGGQTVYQCDASQGLIKECK